MFNVFIFFAPPPNITILNFYSLKKGGDIVPTALRPLPWVWVVVKGPRHHKGGRVCAEIHHDHDDESDDHDDYDHVDNHADDDHVDN